MEKCDGINIATGGCTISSIQKPEMVFIDFDGVISQNSVLVLFKFIHQFINRYTPVPFEVIQDFLKSTICFHGKQSTELLFSSLGIEDKLPEFFPELGKTEKFEDIQIVIEKEFYSFIDFCNSNSIRYQIFSSASRNVKRFSELIDRIDSTNIYNLNQRPKARAATFLEVAKELEIDLKNSLYVDDAPLALLTGKLHGIKTVMMLNDVFTINDYKRFSSYIDYKINSFTELEAILSRDWQK